MNSSHIFRTSLILIVSLTLLSACSLKRGKNEVAAEPAAPTGDITRPPEVVAANKPLEEEGNPDETISFDEWRKKREAERAQRENP